MSIYKPTICCECKEEINLYCNTKLYIKDETDLDVMCEDCKVSLMSHNLSYEITKDCDREVFFNTVKKLIKEYMEDHRIKIDLYLQNNVGYYTGEVELDGITIRVLDEGDIYENKVW